MATTITYKGAVIATATNTTKTLNTQGKYMEGNVIVTDVTIPDPDFVVRITYNTQTHQWEPQCTFAEIQAAHVAGKTIGIIAQDIYQSYMGQAFCQYVDSGDDQFFEYIVDAYDGDYLDGNNLVGQGYAFRSTGITFNGQFIYYDTSDATATSADVLSGKTFFNSNGQQTGTISSRSSSDLTASGSIVTVPAGYYSAQASKAVAAGAVAVPTTAITANPTVSVSTSGLITASVAAASTIAPTVTAGYVSTGASGAMNVSGSSTLQLTTQAAATITPSESQQTAVASQRYTTGNVVVAAISANYVGSGITWRSSTDLTASGSAVTAPAGYYSAAATKTVSAGTAGTPTAAKGTVSNHQISITPSVTNTTGWITGSTKTGTAVTVSASELVSGTSTISANGTYDVTNYASAAVSIPIVTYYTGSAAPTAGFGSDGDIYLQS